MTPAQAAERAICGALLQDTQDAAHWRVVHADGLQQGDIQHPLHQAIWVAVHALRSGGRPADLITIGAELQHLPIYQLREYGAAYLAALTLEAPAAPESTAAHAIVVRRHAIWLAREQLGHEIARSPHDPSLVLRAQQLHLAESTLGSGRSLPGMIEAIGEDWGRPLPPVEPTGLRDLDQAMGGGLRAESCCVVLGATGQGKSGLVLQMARSIARRRGVLVITSELSRRQVEARLLAQELRRPWRDIYELGTSALPDLLHAARPHCLASSR